MPITRIAPPGRLGQPWVREIVPGVFRVGTTFLGCYAVEDAGAYTFIDVGLPGLDGFEVAKRIRAAPLASIRLIALSGHGLPQDRSRASEAGFDEHLVKPITPDRLMEALAPATPESRREAV